MNNEKYSEFLTKEYLMGPNSLRLLDELLSHVPEPVSGRVLDLGCGMAVTSLFLARETQADTVYAADLWITATDNYARIRSWGEESRIIPLHSDACDLPFADGFFRAIVSVDAYHYFGCSDGFFAERMLPLLEAGGYALIAVPGLKKEFTDGIPALMTEWAEDDALCFHNALWWKEHISQGAQGVEVSVYESEQFDEIWNDWFRSGHEYAANDKVYLERGVADMLSFVLIVVRKK